VGAVVLALGGARLAGAREALRSEVGPHALALAAVVATVATLGSLYLSEVAHFVPCRLCWYQRAAMYPLGPILAVAAWRRAYGVRPWAAGLAAIGASVSVYHLVIERFPSLETSMCDVDNPCSLIWVERFGYLTIPGMALSGFLLILVLLAVARPAPAATAAPLPAEQTGASHG
jgi:disulfide bond formation protein DsbB